MKTIYTDKHRLQHGNVELMDGQLLPCFEKPERADLIIAQIRASRLGPVLEPDDFDIAPLARVHAPGYLRFLQSAWDAWVEEHGSTHHALPLNWPIRGMRSDIEPEAIDGKLSYFSFDAGSPITPGTWQAVTHSAYVALTGQQCIAAGERAAFALCRPPGHHAAADYYGGYCFLNNAAIAAQAFLDQGAARVAVLDIDYHHANGTQAIFYARDDVLVLSLHGDPRQEFPYFLGYADETGVGQGEGFNANYPLPWGTDAATWFAALESACQRITAYAPDALVVSLGVDTYKGDPISRFLLDREDYPRLGQRLARLGLPTLMIMEGGYAVDAIGINTVSVLTGFVQA